MVQQLREHAGRVFERGVGGGVGGNVDYKRAPKFAPGPSKKKYDGMSALEKVKAEIRAKHGKGAIMDTKKK